MPTNSTNFSSYPSLVLVALLALAACDSATDDPTSSSTPPTNPDVGASPADDLTAYDPAVEPGPVSLRKLTRAQYENSVTDIFGSEVSVPPTAEPDAVLGGLAALGAAGKGANSANVLEQKIQAVKGDTWNIKKTGRDDHHRVVLKYYRVREDVKVAYRVLPLGKDP